MHSCTYNCIGISIKMLIHRFFTHAVLLYRIISVHFNELCCYKDFHIARDQWKTIFKTWASLENSPDIIIQKKTTTSLHLIFSFHILQINLSRSLAIYTESTNWDCMHKGVRFTAHSIHLSKARDLWEISRGEMSRWRVHDHSILKWCATLLCTILIILYSISNSAEQHISQIWQTGRSLTVSALNAHRELLLLLPTSLLCIILLCDTRSAVPY